MSSPSCSQCPKRTSSAIYLSTSQSALTRENTGISATRVTPRFDTAWTTNGGANVRFRRQRPAQATVREAIEYLASACDGAVRRDGHGFNREHVAIGHHLAHKARWSRGDRRQAAVLAKRYAGQLQRAGLLNPRSHRQTAPAWATDPTGVHRLRYWNGTRWTALTAP